MHIILISGKAQHGKDTTAAVIQEVLEERGESVLITHYADLVKYICKTFFAWDGNKDEYGRSLLQYVGTDVVRAQKPDYWVGFIADILKMFEGEWDYVIIPDTRFPNEVSVMKENFGAYHLRVHRPGFISPLSAEQQMHPSETALDNSKPDAVLINNSDRENLRHAIVHWLDNEFEYHSKKKS